MAMKVYPRFLELKSHNQMQFSIKPRTPYFEVSYSQIR